MKFYLKKDDVRKNQILEATYKCIYEQGAKAVTLRSIAEKAGVSQGLLHYYFKSKKRLLSELTQVLLDKTIDSLEKRLVPSDPAKKKIEIYFEEGKNFVVKSYELMVVFQEIWLLGKRDSTLKKVFGEYVRRFAAIFDGFLEQGEKEGTFNKVRKDSYTLHVVYHAFVLGMGLMWQFGDRVADINSFDVIIKSMEKIILKNPSK